MKQTVFDPSVRSYRQEVLSFAAERFQTKPEHLWRFSPSSAVLRRADNQKWYGVLMSAPKKRLGLPGSGSIDILNIKCDSELGSSLCMSRGFLPAYHMNHKGWLTVFLDGTVPKETILSLLETSYELTAFSKRRKKAGAIRNSNWIIPANPKYYDLEELFRESETILWKQRNRIFPGSLIFLYVTAPVSAICYKCRAAEVNIPHPFDDGKIRMNQAMRLELLTRYEPSLFSRERLIDYGIFAVRSPRNMPNSLLSAIREYEADSV